MPRHRAGSPGRPARGRALARRCPDAPGVVAPASYRPRARGEGAAGPRASGTGGSCGSSARHGPRIAIRTTPRRASRGPRRADDLEARGAWRNLGGHPGSLPPRSIAAHAGPRGLDGAWSGCLSGGLRRDGLGARPGACPPPTPPEREQEIEQGHEQEHRQQEKLSRRPRPHRCPPAATSSRGAVTAPPLRAPRSPRAWSCPPGRSSCGSSP